eukprot:SAG11_NODE_1933_length_4040_cov_12.707435_2_plen_93_part_00
MSSDQTTSQQNKRPAVAAASDRPERDDTSRMISELIASRAQQERAFAQQQELLRAQQEQNELLRAQTRAMQMMVQQATRGAPPGGSSAQAAQ